MDRKIEAHADFTLSPKGIDLLELIDPELRENDITPELVGKLEEKADGPVRDFKWNREGKQIRVSEMDVETMLLVAQHCVKRANLYHDKIMFFLEIIEIISAHAHHKFRLDIPDSLEGINEKLEQLRNVRAQQEKELENYLRSSSVSDESDVQSLSDGETKN